ncbi:hypothetical protein AAFF_G00072580 [Aldrovandia affinis]|uniref:Uncharacterized protein n=1 Tax=Aldrovandia affinis TaxID=143900 RepID=A0AAD7WEA2_9TELE|nr:hypothetical protein AAFF_G00072580 [Aldrovandia affinis]
MGVEEWESKYKVQGRSALSEFLDKEEEQWADDDDNKSMIIRMARVCRESSGSRFYDGTEMESVPPATYPEEYDTIDRRRRKKLRDHGRDVSSVYQGLGRMREDSFPPDISSMPSAQLLRHKRGEEVLRQVAEMEEEEEQMTPCLRPYKNGLLYKTRMWAKNKLEDTLENYVAYQEEEAARLRVNLEWDSEGSDELQYSVGSEEEVEEIALLAEATNTEDGGYCGQSRYASSYGAHTVEIQGYRDKKNIKGKMGGWAPEAMLSPVEEPIDEYVDPMDELQCLVETVSEYLAEKEEEISKYGSLPRSGKSRLSSQGSARTDSVGDDQSITSKQAKEEMAPESKESKSDALNEQGMSGVKNAVSSLFSSFTEKVGSGSKQPPESRETVAPAESGISKLLSFIPKSTSPTPVAVAPPAQESAPDRKFSLQSLLPFQSPDVKDGIKTQDGNQDAKPSEPQIVSLPQMPQADGGGLLSGFKALSASLFQEQKPAATKEESMAASMFGKNLGFPWQKDTPEPPKPHELPVITTQPKAIVDMPGEPEKPSPVDSSRFGSSGNLSQASSQLSGMGPDSAGGSELEERRDPESFHSYHSTGSYRPTNGHATWDEEEDTRPSPELGQGMNNTVQTDRISPVLLPAPQEKKSEKPLKSFLDVGPPPFSPSRVHWLKAINKVRLQLQEPSGVPVE